MKFYFVVNRNTTLIELEQYQTVEEMGDVLTNSMKYLAFQAKCKHLRRTYKEKFHNNCDNHFIIIL